jgi:hypothetical protein
MTLDRTTDWLVLGGVPFLPVVNGALARVEVGDGVRQVTQHIGG